MKLLQDRHRKDQKIQKRDHLFVLRACAVKMHMDMSQEWVYARIYRRNAGSQMEHPDQAPAFTLTARSPQCGHTVWGISEHLSVTHDSLRQLHLDKGIYMRMAMKFKTSIRILSIAMLMMTLIYYCPPSSLLSLRWW